MTKPKKKAKKTQSARMQIQGTNTQVIILEEQSLNGPQGNHEALVTIAPAQLTDASGPIFNGNISLQIRGANVTPTFFPIITRLLTPFKGDFRMDLSGIVLTQTSQYVTVQVDEIVGIRIIPA